MRKKITIFLVTVVFALFLAFKGYSQKGDEKVQDTSTGEKDKQQEPVKSIENKQEGQGQQAQSENKQEPSKQEAESKKTKEQIESTEIDTEEITPEEDEWGGNVWDTKDIEKREGWRARQDRIQGGFGTDDMWKY